MYRHVDVYIHNPRMEVLMHMYIEAEVTLNYN